MPMHRLLLAAVPCIIAITIAGTTHAQYPNWFNRQLNVYTCEHKELSLICGAGKGNAIVLKCDPENQRVSTQFYISGIPSDDHRIHVEFPNYGRKNMQPTETSYVETSKRTAFMFHSPPLAQTPFTSKQKRQPGPNWNWLHDAVLANWLQNNMVSWQIGYSQRKDVRLAHNNVTVVRSYRDEMREQNCPTKDYKLHPFPPQ